jgi:hypothetical protein
MSLINNKVFGSDDLRKYILSFIVQDRCMSCHQPVIENCNNINYKKYWCNDWKRMKCNKFKFGNYHVCNWCYYYVWEYT